MEKAFPHINWALYLLKDLPQTTFLLGAGDLGAACSFCYCFEHGKRNSTPILCLCPKRIISRLKGICQHFAGTPVLPHHACPFAKGSVPLIVPAEWQFLLPPLHFTKASRKLGSKPHSLYCSQAIGRMLMKKLRRTRAVRAAFLWNWHCLTLFTCLPKPVFVEKTALAVSWEVHTTTKASVGPKQRMCVNLHWKDSWIVLCMNDTMTVYIF